MTDKRPRRQKNLKIIKIVRPGRYLYETPDGTVTVYGQRGKPLTNERIFWLLELAKKHFLEECE